MTFGLVLKRSRREWRQLGVPLQVRDIEVSKRKKLHQRIQQNPKNVSFGDLRTLLEAYDFELRRSSGSHHSFVRQIRGQPVLLTIPYSRPLKAVYVKKALALIEQIEVEEEEEDE